MSGLILAKGSRQITTSAIIQAVSTVQTSIAATIPMAMRIDISRRRLPAKSDTIPMQTPKTSAVSVDRNIMAAKPWLLMCSVSMAMSAR